MTDKQTQDNLQMINFRMTPAEIATLDKVAHELGQTRSQLIRHWITIDLDEYATLKKVGIVRVGLTIRDVFEWLADKQKKAADELEQNGSIKA